MMTSSFSLKLRRALLPLAGLPLLLGSCRHDVTVAPAYDTNYYPVVVGTYRTYAVSDSTWTAGRPTVSTYQLRERVAEQFVDAVGQPAYRLVRSRRALSTDAWRDDSVLVVQVLPRAVLLTRDNVRTVELVYPAEAGKAWNAYAFTVNTQATNVRDSITNLTRVYGPAVGGAYTTPAAGGAAAKTYDATVLTKTILPGSNNSEDVNAYYQRGVRQVYARGVGLVLRRRFSYYTYTVASPGAPQVLTPGVIQTGSARRETLIDSGPL